MGEYMSNNQIYSKRPMHGVAVHRYLLQWRLIWSSELVVYHILPSVQKTWLSTFLTYNRNKEYTLCTGAVLTERLHPSIYLSIYYKGQSSCHDDYITTCENSWIVALTATFQTSDESTLIVSSLGFWVPNHATDLKPKYLVQLKETNLLA